MTHHNATFVVIATDGASLFFGLSENGEIAVGNYETRLDAIANMLRAEVASCVATDTPLIVVVGKNRRRATAGEVSLTDFARQIVRDATANLPETAAVYVAGSAQATPNAYYTPRVFALPLAWDRYSYTAPRVRGLLAELAFGDEGLDLLPKTKTHAPR